MKRIIVIIGLFALGGLTACENDVDRGMDEPATVGEEATAEADRTGVGDTQRDNQTRDAEDARNTAGEDGDAATGARLEVAEHEQLGEYLTDAEGRSLYLFEADSQGESACYDACAEAWPPFVTEGEVTAGEEVDGEMLGTIERDGGATQVTYGGHPLYYFVRDEEPGDIEGQDVEGFGAEWYLVSPAGEPVEAHGAEQ